MPLFFWWQLFFVFPRLYGELGLFPIYLSPITVLFKISSVILYSSCFGPVLLRGGLWQQLHINLNWEDIWQILQQRFLGVFSHVTHFSSVGHCHLSLPASNAFLQGHTDTHWPQPASLVGHRLLNMESSHMANDEQFSAETPLICKKKKHYYLCQQQLPK